MFEGMLESDRPSAWKATPETVGDSSIEKRDISKQLLLRITAFFIRVSRLPGSHKP